MFIKGDAAAIEELTGWARGMAVAMGWTGSKGGVVSKLVSGAE